MLAVALIEIFVVFFACNPWCMAALHTTGEPRITASFSARQLS